MVDKVIYQNPLNDKSWKLDMGEKIPNYLIDFSKSG
jgi:hypothetical protein